MDLASWRRAIEKTTNPVEMYARGLRLGIGKKVTGDREDP
jgi:hypothetical protein